MVGVGSDTYDDDSCDDKCDVVCDVVYGEPNCAVM